MIQFDDLTNRQKNILDIVGQLQKASIGLIVEKIAAKFDRASRITVIRDLNFLVKNGFVKREGEKRGVLYRPRFPFLLRMFDTNSYFTEEADERSIMKTSLDFRMKAGWELILNKEDKELARRITAIYRSHKNQYDQAMTKKELERITIEFSWKSSHIEGNTYTLLDTERLIREHKETAGKTKEEAAMILNHKKALEYAWQYAANFKKINTRSIEELHDLIMANLGIKRGLRKHPVGIVGTAYKPYDNVFQIREALEKLCRLVNGMREPFLKALIAVAGLSYIQPFADGNKRTSRLLGNAVLLAYDYCPLSYRSIDETEYKKAIILFYEQHTLFEFKKIFLEQYEFAVKNYFL